MDEDELDGLDLGEEDETGREEEEVEYDEETQALLTRVREEEQAKAKSQIDDFRAQYGRRFGKARQELAQMGLSVDEDGTPLVKDPQAALAWAKQNVVPLAIGERREPEEEEEEIVIDRWDEPEELNRKVNALAERRAAKAVETAVGPLMERVEAILGLVGRQSQQSQVETARGALERLGFGGLADDPEYRKSFDAAMQSAVKQYGPAALANDELIKATAYLSLAGLSDDTVGKAKQTQGQGPTQAERLAAAQRQAANTYRPSRGLGQADYDDADLMGAQLLGVSVEEYRRLGEDTTVDATLARRRKQNGTVRR